MPNFFIYAKDKTEYQVEPANDSTMNRISAAIPPSRVKYNKKIGKMDWRMLINQNVGYTVMEDSPVIQSYNWWLRHQNIFNVENDNIKGCDSYAAKCTREHILEESGESLQYVVNSIVAYLYGVKDANNKNLLWDCFGWEIVKNLERNLEGAGKICPICGRRFKPRSNANTTYCSDECAAIAEKQRLARHYESKK